MSTEKTRNFFVLYLLGGVVVYFIYGLWHSKLGKGQMPDGIAAAMEAPARPK
jgi:hypothetical protein